MDRIKAHQLQMKLKRIDGILNNLNNPPEVYYLSTYPSLVIVEGIEGENEDDFIALSPEFTESVTKEYNSIRVTYEEEKRAITRELGEYYLAVSEGRLDKAEEESR